MIRTFTAYVPARTLLLGASEAFLVGLAFVAAIVLRFGGDADLVLGYEHGLIKIGLVIAVFFLCMWHLDLYDGQFLCSRFEILPRLLQVVGIMSILLAFVYYTYPQAQLGRSVLVIGAILVVLLVFSWRQMFFSLLRQFNCVQRAIVFGTGTFAIALGREAKRRPELGIDLLGYVDCHNQSSEVDGLPCFGTSPSLPEIVRGNRVSRVIVALEDRRGKLPIEELLRLKSQGVVVEKGDDFYESITGKVALDSLRPSSLLFVSGYHLSGLQVAVRRVVSFLFALVGLAIASPLMLVAWIGVWLDTGRPVIFRQSRLGKDGKVFTIYKFRTMRNDPNRDDDHKPAQKGDSRVTRVGRWLRRTRIDEIPQLYNILRGDMSFVGPRPFVPSQEAELLRVIPFYNRRLDVKPGATGWAQVNRGYCASLDDNVEKLAYDLFYIKHMSVGFDLLIILRTFKILLLGRGAQ